MRILTSLLLLFLLVQQTMAQTCSMDFNPKRQLVASTILCPDAMLEDLAQLHKNILEVHPNPTYYGELNDLSSAYQKACAEVVQKPINVFDFLLIVNTYLSVLKDSHTGINPKQFLYNVNANRQVLPFFVSQIDQKFYINYAFDPNLTRGAELIQIDQFEVAELYNFGKLLSLNEGNAYAASNDIASEYISVAYNLLSMSLKEENAASIQLVEESGDTIHRSILFTPSWKYFLSSLFDESEEMISYTFDEQNNAILTVTSFEPLSLNHFQKEIDAFFQEVKQRNCPSLYIDLRNNLGGLIRAEEYLFSYINTKQTPIRTNYLYKRSDYDRFARLSPLQEMQFINRAKNNYPNGLISKEYDFYKLPKGSIATILYDYVPKNNLNYAYDGPCQLVINANSMSASVLFAGWFKFIERGEILGSTCMGGMGGTFGNPAVITLNHTKIDVMISTLKFTPLHIKERELSPIEPSIPIRATRRDLIERKDPFYEYLLNYQKK